MRNLIEIFNKPASLSQWAYSFLGIIALRVFIEQFLAVSPPLGAYELAVEFFHNLLFFALAIILIWIAISLIIGKNPGELSGIFLWASLLIIFPPLLDIAKTKGEVFWSFYMLSSPQELLWQYLTIFGKMPSGIVYFGSKIIFLSAVFFSFILVWSKTKSLVKSFVGALASYSILFLLGALPSFLGYLYYCFFEGKSFFEIQGFHIAQLFGSPEKVWGVEISNIKYAFAYKLGFFMYPMFVISLIWLFFLISREKLVSSFKNFRLPQLTYHWGLLLIGVGLGFLTFPQNGPKNIFAVFSFFCLGMSVALAWKASVIPNDIYDIDIDKITNSDRPLPRKIFTLEEFKDFGLVCFMLSLLGGLVVGFPFFFLLLIYQILAFFYSAEPYRLKKFPGIATFISALASINILFLGFILVSPGQTISRLSPRIIFLLLLSYTLSIPAKDLKDVEGDKKFGVWTIPSIFGEEKGRLIISINIFISYMASVFFLNEFRLFAWAVLFASLTFLAVNSKKIKPRQLLWWILGFATLYSLVLTKTVFLK